MSHSFSSHHRSLHLPPPRSQEVLQRGPLVSRRACREAAQAHGLADWAYGTTSQTVLLSSARARCTYFFQRSVQNFEQTPGEWESWEVPWPEEAPRQT